MNKSKKKYKQRQKNYLKISTQMFNKERVKIMILKQ
jgi:hypothetical protein